ncbi:MAG: arsenate reductase (azurin) small subunit [Ectothiorhodospiraceae bacterium]
MKLSRRNFLKLSGSAAGSASVVGWAGTAAAQPDGEAAGRATLDYPREEIGRAGDLTTGEAVSFTYPDGSSPCAVIKTGEPVPGGAGPDGDIVAYSVLCTHMGCAVSYDRQAGVFKCPCHFSIFDPHRLGQQVSGQATVDLPRIELEYNESTDTLTAVSVLGLIAGRQANVL